jgi:penicillin V acylase-like amidase (Ntn superfamily)
MVYWKEAGGLEKSLPGTSRAADRFVRTMYLFDALPAEASKKYISGTPQQNFKFQAPMSVLSLMRSAGTPLGFSLELAGGKTCSGNAVDKFVDAKLLTFQDLADVAPAK